MQLNKWNNFFLGIIIILSLSSFCFAESTQAKIVVAGGDVVCDSDKCGGKNIILISENAKNWQLINAGNLNETEFSYNNLTFLNGKFFLAGACGVFESTDALKWEQISYYDCFRSMVSFNNMLFGLGYSAIFTSVTGRSFNKFFEPQHREIFRGIAYGLMTYVVVAGDLVNGGLYTSVDQGKTWDALGEELPTVFKDVIFHERFVAVGERYIAVSDDAKSWRFFKIDINIKSITWGAGVFIVVGNAGKIAISEDGYFWKLIKTNTAQHLNKVIWADAIAKFIAVGDKGTILTSNDGRKWSQQKVKTTYDLKSIAIN